MAKPILVSGMQPSGRLHIGNYLGALKNLVELQNSGKYQCYFTVVDLHSLTEPFEPEEKRLQTLDLVAGYLAAGLNPKKSVLFLQSQVPAHTELTWIFNTITPMGELERMTQYKDKADRHGSNAGLFTYPVLMAADILLYDPKWIPVGDDQSQHIELARTIARKFNARFGNTFIEPQILLTPAARIMSLSEPSKKMSKSIPTSCVFMDDSPEEIMQKVKRAVTDSGSEITYDKARKPALSNLITIYGAFSDKTIPAIEKHFSGKGYGQFKLELAQLIIDSLEPYRKKKAQLIKKPAVLTKILKEGSVQARKVADKKIEEVKKKIGIAL